jgi:hypothetical protein
LKIKILRFLSKVKKTVSLYEIEAGTGINYNSLLPNCIFLNDIGFINLEQKKLPNKTYYEIKITDKGIKTLELLK